MVALINYGGRLQAKSRNVSVRNYFLPLQITARISVGTLIRLRFESIFGEIKSSGVGFQIEIREPQGDIIRNELDLSRTSISFLLSQSLYLNPH